MKRRTAISFIGGGLISACGASTGSSTSTNATFTASRQRSQFPYLGLNVGTEMNWTARRDALVPYYKEAGAKWLRVWYNWAAIERNPRDYNLDYIYPNLNYAKEQGFLITFVIWGTPAHAGSEGLAAVPDQSAFKRYCDWLRSYLSELVDAWEVGNEPNLTKYFTGSPEAYVRMLADAYEILSGRALVIAAGPSGAAKPEYWQALLDADLEHYCDRVNIHPYQKNPGRVLNQVDDFKSRVTKPLWITELGLPTKGNSELDKANFTSILLPELQSRVETLLWYRSIQGNQIHPLTYGLLEVDKETNEIMALPAYTAYQTFAQGNPTL